MVWQEICNSGIEKHELTHHMITYILNNIIHSCN